MTNVVRSVANILIFSITQTFAWGQFHAILVAVNRKVYQTYKVSFFILNLQRLG